MSTTVSYKGNTLATVSNNTKTLETEGKYLEADIILTDSHLVPSGTLTITGAGTADVTNYASASVQAGTAGTPALTVSAVENHAKTIRSSVINQTGWITGGTVSGASTIVSASDLVSGALSITSNGNDIDVTNYATVDVAVSGGSPTLETVTKSYTPTTSQQTETITPSVGYDGIGEVDVTVAAMSSGTEGTPTATKGAVSGNAVTVTPSVTNSAGYISGGTHTGTGVSVSASELVSGSETKTANGTYDVTNLAEIIVDVSGGTSKNTQVVQGTTRTTSSTLTAIGAELTVAKTGTYDVYWSAFRSSTSSSYTYGTRLYIDGSAYGSENKTWSNHVQNNHLQNVSLTQNQKIRVYGRESRGTSYYIYAPTLVIVEK